MLGTILIVILVLALVGAFPGGRTAGSGVMRRQAAWAWFFSSWLFS
jgi:hypothetical protein